MFFQTRGCAIERTSDFSDTMLLLLEKRRWWSILQGFARLSCGVGNKKTSKKSCPTGCMVNQEKEASRTGGEGIDLLSVAGNK